MESSEMSGFSCRVVFYFPHKVAILYLRIPLKFQSVALTVRNETCKCRCRVVNHPYSKSGT